MEHATSKTNGKIQVFWGHEVVHKVLENDDQQITCDIQHAQISQKYITTFFYVKCKD